MSSDLVAADPFRWNSTGFVLDGATHISVYAVISPLAIIHSGIDCARVYFRLNFEIFAIYFENSSRCRILFVFRTGHDS